MQETILEAFERIEGPKDLRKSGCIPGVLYGEGYEKGIPVAFEEASLTKIINTHGANAKVLVDFNGNRKLGFIKDLQRHSLTRKVIHSDVQVTSQNHKVKMKLPIVFTGISDLERRRLVLQVYNNHADISGEAGVLPEVLTINVGNMALHDSIRIKDLKIDSRIKVHDDFDEIYATIIEMRGVSESGDINLTDEVNGESIKH